MISSSIPVYFVWLKYISWFNYSNDVLLVNQWDGVPNISCDDLNSTSCFRNGEDVITYYEIDKVMGLSISFKFFIFY